MPKVSICVPVYNMEKGEYFLKRNLESILSQSFKDYEIVVADNSPDEALRGVVESVLEGANFKFLKNPEKGMANNTNFALDNASGEILKVLYQDDYFFAENSLQEIVNEFKPDTKWLVTGCVHDNNGEIYIRHLPTFSEEANTIGSPSVLALSREVEERFNPDLTWVLDLELYKRLFRRYGPPVFLNEVNVVIGLGSHQVTNKLTMEQKLREELSI